MKRLLLIATAILGAGCYSGYSDDTPASGELRVRRGAFQNDLVLSGELESARGETLVVPPLPSWETAIKWIAEDGSTVRAGEPVVELDNSALTADLESKRQAAMQSIQELQQKEAEWEADLEQKQLDVEKKLADLEKAKLDALVPRELVSMRTYETNQTKLRRTTVDHEKARDLLLSRRTAIDAERDNLQLRIDKAQREIAIADEAIAALVLRAPKTGIVVVRDHPWEGRKLQTGDRVFVGFPIAMLPDLESIRVTSALADVDDGKVAVGMPVTVTMDGYPTLPFNGRVTAISAVAQESRRASLRRHFQVLIALDRLDPERMRPGLSARVVVRRNSNDAVLLAPRAAIDLNVKTPRVRTSGGAFKEVKLGACNAQDCIVSGGVTEGERLAPVVEAKRG